MSQKVKEINEINEYILQSLNKKRERPEKMTDDEAFQKSLEESLDWITFKIAKFEAERLTKALNTL